MSSIVKILVFLVLLSSCAGEGNLDVPDDVIPRDSMVSALMDMHLIEGAKVGQKMMGDTVKINTYYAKLYQKYGVTKKQFEKSFQFYSEHPDAMNKMYQEVIERLNKIQQEPQRTPLIESTDSINNSLPDTVPLGKSFMQSMKTRLDSNKQQQDSTASAEST